MTGLTVTSQTEYKKSTLVAICPIRELLIYVCFKVPHLGPSFSCFINETYLYCCYGKYPWRIYGKQRTSLGERSRRFSRNP